MSTYMIHVRLTQTQFRHLLEQANHNGRSLEAVAASLIGDSLEKQAAARERDRRATIDRLCREIDRKPPVDPTLRRHFDLSMLRQLAGIPSPSK